MTSRRQFLEQSALVAVGLSLPTPRPGALPTIEAAPRGFIDLGHQGPDSVLVQTSAGDVRLVRDSNGKWSANGVTVTTDGARVTLAAPGVAIKRIHLRWRGDLTTTRQLLGDAWERGYGDLEWRSWIPDRVMPWYVATTDGRLTHTYGVKTGARAFCFWQVDQQGVSLWADVRSGGVGVQLGDRVLSVCDIAYRSGRAGETSFAAIHAFCKQMCSNPRLPSRPVYGSNDWYWAYGKNSASTVRTDARHIVELSPAGGNRPFAVIDDGWQPERSKDKLGVGLWDRGNENFPDMPGLAAEVKRIGARPGVWVRPLLATKETPDALRLSRDKAYVDPSIPENLKKIEDDMARIRGWGYELIKHDYTTFDIFGRWGFQMGAEMTRGNWTFAGGPARTTAEVINDLYATIRKGAGDSLVMMGCDGAVGRLRPTIGAQ